MAGLIEINLDNLMEFIGINSESIRDNIQLTFDKYEEIKERIINIYNYFVNQKNKPISTSPK